MSQENQINVKLEEGVQTVEVLTGPAKNHSYPKRVKINGILTAPYSYLEKRVNKIDQKQCMLIVDRDKGSLEFVLNENSEYSDNIKGELKLNPDFLKFGINSGKSYTTLELAEMIKMNRFFFAETSVALKLISTLKDFKAKVDKAVEQRSDGRGNDRSLFEQAVSSNVPESFNMHLPVFKGQEPKAFEVEISINGRDLSCSLISPQINDIINEVKNKAIDEQLESIKEIAPELAIIEV